MSKFDNRPKNKPSKSKAPKAYKADGSPKTRWSTDQRSAAGHDPRRRGGQPRTEYRGTRPDNRFEARADRDGDNRRDDRADRGPADRDPADRFQRTERGGSFSYTRPTRSHDRPNREGDDRPRRSFNDRDDRAPRSGDDRPRFERDDRPRREFDRDSTRPHAGARGPRQFQGDPTKDRFRKDRDDRRSDDRGGDRGRSSSWGRDADTRRSTWSRDERPSFDRKDRNDRPRFERNDRAERPQRSFAEGEEAAFDADIMSWSEAADVEVDASGVTDADSFHQLGLPDELVATLTAQGITEPFPIQTATIPVALAGRDVLGRGRTGSGKTLSFGLPMLTRISQNNGFKDAPAGLVLVPTRELALQVADALSPLAKSLGLSLALVAGGMSYGPQIKALSTGVDVVVATPGRLIDLMEQGVANLSKVLVTVLDEADHMADMGFMPDVKTILDATPERAQRLLFSATLDDAVGQLVKRYLHDPSTHEVDSGQASIATMEHHLLLVHPHHKNETTSMVANREGKTVIFARTQMGTSRIADQLRAAGVMAGALHGGLTQGARARVLAAFKDGKVPVLVATDVAARGIHVDDVSLVMQVDPPQNSKDYLHRAGRTARAGEKGVVVTIVLPHQRRTMQRMAADAGVSGDLTRIEPGDALLAELTGARPIDHEPISEYEYNDLIAPPKRAPRQGRAGGRKQFGDRGGFRKSSGDRGGFHRGGDRGNDRGGFRKQTGGRERVGDFGGWNRGE